jgi:L-asparagine transporter-like permease
MISIGGIIGAGLFVASSTTILVAGPAIVVSYLLAGVLILLVMRMLGEMVVAEPTVRAFTDFPRLALGSGAGFVVGWLYWYFWVVTVAVEAIAGAKILHVWFPMPAWELGIGLMAVMTAVNLFSTRSYGEFEFWFASIKVAAILAFIAVSAAYAFGFLSSGGPTFSNLVSHGGFMPNGSLAVLAGISTVFFSLTGAEITTIAAAESKEPARAVARMTTSVVGRVMVFYVGAVFFIVSVVPWDSVRQGESPFTLVLNHIHIPWAGTVMTIVILTAVLSCLNSAFYVSSRVLFALAGHGDAPQWLVQLNSRSVPARSVFIGSVGGIIGVYAAVAAPQTIFAFLVNASGALMLFVYIMTSLAQIRLRRRRMAAGVSAPAVQMWLFPWASYFAIACMLAVLIAMAFTPAMVKDLYFSILALLAAVLAYGIMRRRRQRSSGRVVGSN